MDNRAHLCLLVHSEMELVKLEPLIRSNKYIHYMT